MLYSRTCRFVELGKCMFKRLHHIWLIVLCVHYYIAALMPRCLGQLPLRHEPVILKPSGCLSALKGSSSTVFCSERPSTIRLNSYPGLVKSTTPGTRKPVHSLKEDLKYEKERKKERRKGNWGKINLYRKSNKNPFLCKEETNSNASPLA